MPSPVEQEQEREQSTQPQSQHQSEEPPEAKKLPIKIQHCRFCNHLLLATTRQVTSLPTRKLPAQDSALILPLLGSTEEDEDEDDQREGKDEGSVAREGRGRKQKQKHYTILLSTTIPDRKPTLIRREDGFEKRLFLRCGRCRVVMGYFLDPVHFENEGVSAKGVQGRNGESMDEQLQGRGEEDGEEEEGAKVVYVLPGALVETDSLEDEEVRKKLDREWSDWFAES